MSTKPPSGTRDFLPAEIKRREYVVDIVRDVYERHGFEPLETPAFENIDTLLGKYGDEGNKLIFKILRRGEHESSGGSDLALRYDLTVPLARVVAQYQNELPRFFKRYQMQPVWRADRPAKGRFREFYQCDIDAIGTTSILVEIDLLSAVSEVLERLGFLDFVVRLNHRELLTGLMTVAGVAPALHGDALVAVDKLDKIGPDAVHAELVNRGVAAAAAATILDLFATAFPGDLGHRLATDVRATHALEQLKAIVDLCADTAAGRHLRVDPSLARGLSYYTGAIMEITVPDLSGSLGGGGRYDNLIGMFLGRDIPACGFSLGLERIIFVMTERNMFPATVARATVDVMVTIWNHETQADSLALARTFRSAGLSVDVYPDADKLGKQVKYASSRSVPFVAIVGDDERAAGTVSIKDLRTGAQDTMAREAAADHIMRRGRQTPKDS